MANEYSGEVRRDMDTSETYIKMCDKAGGLQRDWKPKTGDCFIQVYGDQSMSGPLFVSEWFDDPQYETQPDYGHSKRAIWLPRQDQLQEMYLRDMPGGTYQKVATLAEVFHDYHKSNGYPSYAFSMEQLWLAFVQKTNHNKTWDGEKWDGSRD